jgi:predicted transposase YbfD/YdcC
MARITESARIEAANEAAALGFFEEALGGLPDPRRPQGVRYPLRTVVVTALMAMVCGCDDAEAMEVWAEANAEWLSGFLSMPHGPPSQDVFLNVFGALDPAHFNRVFERWAQLVSLRLGATGKHIAIDGKTSRRSADPMHDKPAIHTVSAWMCGAGLVLGQVRTAEKSNEIIAIPELLRALDLRGATVTIDAMGCQTAIAESIVEGGGQYVLAVKDNQPALHGEIKETFAEADDEHVRAQDEEPRPVPDVHESVEKAHGRIETRRVRVVSSLAWLLSFARWKGIGYVAEVHRERVIVATGKTSSEISHYVGSGPPPPAERVAQLVRGHWGIENELHWVLDMAFGEDQARHRARNTAANLTTLRHFALSTVKQDQTRKLGVANSRKRAGFDRSYLLHLIRGGAQ